jgi:DNA-damage-inducible protein D
VVDVVEVLTESPNPRTYWAVLKKRLTGEGAGQTLTNCKQFKMRAKDGKMRDTDCADTEAMLRIVESIPSPKAEPFKQWLAKTGAERIEEANDPEQAFEEWRRRAIAAYMAKGYSEDWAKQRVHLITTRNKLTREWQIRGITSDEIPILTDRLHMGAFGISIDDHRLLKGYPTKDGKPIGSLQDGMTITEIAMENLGEALSVQQHQRNDSHGPQEIAADIDIAAAATAAAREAIEQVTGEPVVSPINAMPASNALWAQLPAADAPKDDAGDDSQN